MNCEDEKSPPRMNPRPASPLRMHLVKLDPLLLGLNHPTLGTVRRDRVQVVARPGDVDGAVGPDRGRAERAVTNLILPQRVAVRARVGVERAVITCLVDA